MSLKSTRPKTAFEGGLWLLLIAFLGSRMWPQVAAAFGVASANERAPDFHLTTLTGEPVSRESLRGNVAMATGDAVAAFGSMNTLPRSYLIDREGRIRSEVTGIFASTALEAAVDRLLAEPVAGDVR